MLQWRSIFELIDLQKGRAIVAAVSEAFATSEKYLAAATDDKPGIFGKLLAEVRILLAEQRWAEAASIVRSALTPGSDFTTLQSLYRIYSRLKPNIEQRPKPSSPF